jgi:hypothetical protein
MQVREYIRTGGAEAEARLARYAALVQQVEALAAHPVRRQHTGVRLSVKNPAGLTRLAKCRVA